MNLMSVVAATVGAFMVNAERQATRLIELRMIVASFWADDERQGAAVASGGCAR
jgi:hypothetical protein